MKVFIQSTSGDFCFPEREINVLERVTEATA